MFGDWAPRSFSVGEEFAVSALRETGSPSWEGLLPLPWSFSAASWRRGLSFRAGMFEDLKQEFIFSPAYRVRR